METTNYNYTGKMKSIVNSRVSDLNSFYCREDLEEALNSVKNAKKDAVRFRMKRLREFCDAVKMDPDHLIKDESLLNNIPTRDELQDNLITMLYEIYNEFPDSDDYMTRIVRHLAPEYKSDTVRTAILKKFVIGIGNVGKPIKVNAVIDFAKSKMSEEERQAYNKAPQNDQPRLAVEKIDDSVFSDERMNTELSGHTIFETLVRRAESLGSRYEIVDRNCQIIEFSGISISEKATNLLLDYFKENGIVIGKDHNALSLLKTAATVTDNSEHFTEIANSILREFTDLTRQIYYKNNRNNADTVYALLRTDIRDARNRQSADWDILRLCCDLANGKFRTNGGKTRIYMYYFAYMFGMTVPFGNKNNYDSETDFEKNLFGDYYSDNLLRYLSDEFDDNTAGRKYEREPTGAGINYKNYVEIIYLYYLYHNELGTPGERIALAEKMIKRCGEGPTRANEKASSSDNLEIEYTMLYKERFLNSVLMLGEEQLYEHIKANYSTVQIEGSSASTISSESYTASDKISELMEIADEYYMESLSLNSALDFISQNEEKTSEKGEEVGVSADYNFGHITGNLIKAKYPNEKRFLRMVDAIEERLNPAQSPISIKTQECMILLLHTLIHYSSPDNPIRTETIRDYFKKEGTDTDGRAIRKYADWLCEIGFDVNRSTKDSSEHSRYYIGTLSYKDEDLEIIIQGLSTKSWTNIRSVTYKFDQLVKKHIKGINIITRSNFIAEYMRYYIAHLEEMEDVDSSTMELHNFPDVYRDIESDLNEELILCRFQPFSEKNIFDMYVLVSLFLYLIEKDK